MSIQLHIEVPKVLNEIVHALRVRTHFRAKPMLNGGVVRNAVMAKVWNEDVKPSKDFDIEIFGDVSQDEIVEILKQFGKVNEQGAQFGIVVLTTSDGQTFDFSQPRREVKVGVGTRGFETVVDGNMTFVEACSRRDFTMNAMLWDFNGNVIDPFNGVEDIRDRVIKPTSEKFREDPLRILRGMQFASRFNLSLAGNARHLNWIQDAAQEFDTIPRSRLFEEWRKWALGKNPGTGLLFLKDANVLHLFPQIANMVGVEQAPEFHPEGDVFIHTVHVTKQAARIAREGNFSDDDTLVLVMSALCHDFGKVDTTEWDETKQRWVAPGHAAAGETPTREFLTFMLGEEQKRDNPIVEKIVKLVREHMAHTSFTHTKQITKRVVKRLANRVGDIEMLFFLCWADVSGRPPIPPHVPKVMMHIRLMADELGVGESEPDKIVTGKLLIREFDVKPGKAMGNIIKLAFEAQLDDVFDNEENAIQWLMKEGLV